jgi:hypothetical protein
MDESEHFTSTAQNVVANEVAEGSSLNDLLQIVSLADESGVAATAGNGRGVLIVDATPPLVTYIENNGSSVVIGFDQAVSTTDNGRDGNSSFNGAVDSEFEIAGDGANYTFNFTDDAVAGGQAWTVMRDTAYTDRFGNQLAANTRVDITLTEDENPGYDIDNDGDVDANVPADSSRFTITIVDPDGTSTTRTGDDANGDIDYSDFFNEMSHVSTASVAATAGTTPTFYMDYPSLMDDNFNSWDIVETYDEYINGLTPRAVGIDNQGPQLAASTYGAMDADATFLLVDNSGTITIEAAHATSVTDTDTIYTSDGGATITGVADDVEIRNVWGYNATTATSGQSTASRLVIKLNETMTAASINDAIAYVYQASEGAVNGGVITNAVIRTTAITANAVLANSSVAATAGMVGEQDGALIVELPDYEATVGTITSDDVLVIQNILVDGVHYSIHISAPALVTTGSSTTENATGLSYQVYRHVFLNNGDEVDGVAVGTQFTGTAFTATSSFTFRERVQDSVAVSFSSTGAVDDSTANFTGIGGGVTATSTDEVVSLTTTSDASAGGTVATYTLSALAAGSINESVSKVVGRDSTLSVSAIDFAGNDSSATITLKKGHGAVSVDLDGDAAVDENERVILNTITGSAIQ